MNALVSLHICADTPEHSLLSYISMDVDEGSGQNLDLTLLETSAWAIISHLGICNKYQNLVCWLILRNSVYTLRQT